MKNFNFYIIAAEQLNKGNYVYGVAYNYRQEIHWNYDLDTQKMDVHYGMATPVFFKQLEVFLESEMLNIVEGQYQFSEERKRHAAELLALNEQVREGNQKPHKGVR